MAIELPDRRHVYEAVAYEPQTGDRQLRDMEEAAAARREAAERLQGEFARHDVSENFTLSGPISRPSLGRHQGGSLSH